MEMAILVGICAVFVVALGLRTQNRLAPLRERVDEAAANIRACIEKRNRLIKQLLDIAAAYAKHEKGIHERISADFNTPHQIAVNPRAALAYVSRLVNTFPELRADHTYLDLSHKLYTLESELQDKHQLHSASVREYNSVRRSFPNDMFAWFGGFGVAEHLDGTDSIAPGTSGKASEPVVDTSKVVDPRVGMIYRDTKLNTRFRIDEISGSNIWSSVVRDTGYFGGGFEEINCWKEHVAEGRYQIE